MGQRVQALVLAIDTEKRQIKLSMKQLIPTSIDEYIAEHKVGDKVSGRVVQVSSSGAQVDLGDGIRGICGAGSGRGGGDQVHDQHRADDESGGDDGDGSDESRAT